MGHVQCLDLFDGINIFGSVVRSFRLDGDGFFYYTHLPGEERGNCRDGRMMKVRLIWLTMFEWMRVSHCFIFKVNTLIRWVCKVHVVLMALAYVRLFWTSDYNVL